MTLIKERRKTNRFRIEIEELMQKSNISNRILSKMSGISLEIVRKIRAGDNSVLTQDIIKRLVGGFPCRFPSSDEVHTLLRFAELKTDDLVLTDVSNGCGLVDIYAHFDKDCEFGYTDENKGFYWFLDRRGGKLYGGPFITGEAAKKDGYSKLTKKDKVFHYAYFDGKRLQYGKNGVCWIS